MIEITASAGLGIKLFFSKYESVDPFYSTTIRYVTDEDMTEVEMLAKAAELRRMIRKDVENDIDNDIEQVKEKRIFESIRKDD